MSCMCYVAVVAALYIILCLSHNICLNIGKKNSKDLTKINFIFYRASIIMGIVSLIACVVFFITKNKIDFFATYLVLFFVYIFFTNFFRTVNTLEEYTSILMKRLLYLIIMQIFLFLSTYVLEAKMPIENLVINRVIIVFIVSSFLYTFKQFMLLNPKGNNDLTNLYFDNCITIYLCVFSILYMCQYNSSDQIGLILLSISIIIIFFDKVDKIMQYLSYGTKDTNKDIEEKSRTIM